MKSLYKKLMFLIISFLPIFTWASVQDNINHASKMAAKYHVSAVQLKATLKGESGFRMYNSNGKVLRGAAGEYGIGQFMPSTWNWMEGMFRQSGGRDLSMYNTNDQIELMAWAFSKNLKSHWVAYKLVYNRSALPKAFLARL
jgi:hypothetical protein